MQEYQKGKVLVNSWDEAEPVTIQTHPSLNIVQVEPQYLTNINPDPHDQTTNFVVPHYSWVQQDIKVTLKLHELPSQKKDFSSTMMINFCSARAKKTSKKKNSLLPFNEFINVAPNLIKSKQIPQGCIPINNIYELQELHAASTQAVCRIILANSTDPSNISDFAIGHLLQ